MALSGDGGDEAFGGYAWRYTPLAMEEQGASLRAAVGRGRNGRAWLGATLAALAARCRVRCGSGNVLENLGRDPAAAYYADLCFLKPHDARALLGKPPRRDPADSPVFEQVTRPYRDCPSDSAVQRAQYADLKVYLPNDPLVKVDRMSMAHSLEIRCPAARPSDLSNSRFAFPTAKKFANGEPKSLLKGLAERRLPEELVHRPKSGFSAPVGAWLAGPYAERFRDDVLGRISKTRDILDRTVSSSCSPSIWRGTDHSYALWAVWMLERWARQIQTSANSRDSHHIRRLGFIVGWGFAFRSALFRHLPLSVDCLFSSGSLGLERLFASLPLSFMAGAFLLLRTLLSPARFHTRPPQRPADAVPGNSLLSSLLAPHPDVFAVLLAGVCQDDDRQLPAERPSPAEADFRLVITVIALSLGFEAAKQGWAQLLLNPGAPNDNGVPFLGDNNLVAVGMAMLLPTVRRARRRPRRDGAARLPVPQHRRAVSRDQHLFARRVLSISAVGACIWWRSRHKLRDPSRHSPSPSLSLFRCSHRPTGTACRPSPPSDDERDDSQAGRLHFWEVAVTMANDRPLVGVGHRGYERSYNRYDFSKGSYGTDRAVHSSWFGVLAELGYPGLRCSCDHR